MINFNFPTLNLKETGNRIHTLRVNCGYTVEEIAGYMGFTGPQAVYKWEWGKSLPTVDNLYALSKLFGVTIEKILVGNDESFYHIGKFSMSTFLYDKKRSARMSTRTRRRCQLALTVLGSQSGASPSG